MTHFSGPQKVSGSAFSYGRLRRATVDWKTLTRDLYAACRERKVSLRAAGVEMGIHPTELSKLQHGNPLSAAGLASLVAWLYPDAIPSWVITPEVAGNPQT